MKQENMDLIDRYVHAVGRQLPRDKRADIETELRSALTDSLEARSQGEPTQDQVVAVLKEFGRPEKVAASYWPEGQYLIGPRLFPLFKMVVGIALTVLVIVQLVLIGVTAVFNPGELPSFEFFSDLINGAFTAFGVIVIVFAVLQRFAVNPEMEKEDWNPLDLPVVTEKDEIKRSDLVVELVFSLIFLAVFIFLPDKIGFIVRPGTEIILNPVLPAYIPLIIVAFLLSIGLDIFLLWRGRWEIWSRLAKIGLNLFGIGILIVLLTSHNAWLAAHGAGGFLSVLESLPQGNLSDEAVVQIIGMQVFRMGFIIALIVTSVDTVRQIYSLVKKLVGGRSEQVSVGGY
jgi:hypothetical protein